MAPRKFLVYSKEERDCCLVDAIDGREREIASYEANIDGYTSQLLDLEASLPKMWPDNLVRFRGKSNEQLFAHGMSDDITQEDMILVSSLNHRDRIKLLLFTERAELAKSEASYKHCLSCLPTDQAVVDTMIKNRHLPTETTANDHV